MRRAILLLLICLALCAPVRAEGAADELYDALDIGQAEAAVPQEARDILGDAGVEDAMEPEGMLSRLADAALEKLGSLWRSAAASGLKLVAVALLCALASAFTDGGTERYVGLAGCLAVSAVAFTDAGSCVGAGVAALEDLQTFSRALLPSLTAAAAAGGAVTRAAAKYAATALFMDILMTAARNLLLPLAYVCLAARTASAALDSPAIDGASKLISKLTAIATTAVMTAFTAWLGITGAVTGAADAVTARAAKTAISAALPVVGGVISDAASTVVAGAGLLKNAVGAFGLIAAASVCLAPFLALGLRYLCYKAAAALAAAFADKRVSGLISELGGVFGMVLGVVGASALMLFISIISVTKAVSG